MIFLLAVLIIEFLLLIYDIVTKSCQMKFRYLVYLITCAAYVPFVILSEIRWDIRWFGLSLLLLIVFFNTLWKLIKRGGESQTYNFEKTIRKSILNVGLVFLVILPILIFPEYETIPTTGLYSIETKNYTLVDHQREELFTPEQDDRRVEVAFWIPKSQNKEEMFPLVLFSHGGLGTINSNESLYLELASHGFVVCSIGHPFLALWTESEDGDITWVDKDYFRELQEEDPASDPEQSLFYYQKWMQLRTEDINFVLDSIIHQSDPRLITISNRIDKERIGVMGHSLGGSAALAMPRLREDIDMVVTLESPFMFDIVGVENDKFLWLNKDYPVPVLNIYSDSSWDNLPNWSQYQRNVEYLEKPATFIESVHLPGAGHFSLTDLSLVSPMMVRIFEGRKPSIEYRDYLKQVNQIILKFSEIHLK